MLKESKPWLYEVTMLKNIFLLLVSIVTVAFIYVESQVYISNVVGSLPKHRKWIRMGNQLRTSCILNCQNDGNCVHVFFKELRGDKSLGKCWKLMRTGSEGYEETLIEEGSLETFELDPAFCKTKDCCRNGVCKRLCGIDPVCYCGDWKLQAANVCFETSNDSYDLFQIRHNGTLENLKLQHKGEATLNCAADKSNVDTKWGCFNDKDSIRNLITDGIDNIVIQAVKQAIKYNKYKLQGFNGNSSCIIFSEYTKKVTGNDVFEIWYVEDKLNQHEGDNAGRSCADIYAIIAKEGVYF